MTRLQAAGPAGLLRLLDVGIVGGGLWVAAWLHGMPWHEGMTAAAASAAALFMLLAESRGLYRSWRTGGLRQELARMLGIWTLTILGLLAVAFLTKSSAEFSRSVFVTWGAAGPVALGTLRLAARWLARLLRRRGFSVRKAAIAGAGDIGRRVARTVRAEPWMGIDVVGFFDDRRRAGDPRRGAEAAGVTGSLEDLVELARKGDLDVVYVAMPMSAGARIERLVRDLATTRVSVYFVPDLAPFALLRSRWFTFGTVPTVSLFETPLSRFERLVKRGEDLFLGGFCLTLAALPMLIIATGIKLESRGPVIFRQIRHGLDGRKIVVNKFRTMHACEEVRPFRQARRDDPRVTPFGRFLRATSLDELPQLINVLEGDMSIVGPRPHPVPLDEKHRDTIDWYALRHRMKPGITGWAQINGFRGETDTPEKMRGRVERDLEYIHNWSLWLDLKILALTPLKGFAGKNAY